MQFDSRERNEFNFIIYGYVIDIYGNIYVKFHRSRTEKIIRNVMNKFEGIGSAGDMYARPVPGSCAR